jgi:murein DD-endopeptidase MepM/ murein hydrolase activator NlpD
MPKKRRIPSSSPLSGTLRVGLVFVGLIGLNVYFFLLRGGTSLRALMKTTELSRKEGIGAGPPNAGGKSLTPVGSRSAPEEVDEARTIERKIEEGDTIERAWRAAELPQRLVGELAAALGAVFDLRTVRAGHTYTLRFDGEDHLRSVDYRVTPALAYHLERGPKGWVATKEEKPIETRVVEVGGTIGSSLYDAVKRTGESTALVGWLVDLFAWDINFYTDTQAGDRFKVVVEKRFLAGKFYKYGRILAAEYAGRTGTFRAFWFQPADGSSVGGAYYTEHGESIQKSLLRTPLKFVRISSAFDRHRFHPILHTEKAHLGVDYAAPLGTPVWATAGGKVTFVGPRGGAGNAVVISHPNGLESTYMHLARFAKGLLAGQKVRQKQVIGYVGATGLATGPHLHFSLKKGGSFIDPLRFHAEREAPLSGRYRTEFADAITPRIEALSAISTRTPDRLVSRGLSAAP